MSARTARAVLTELVERLNQQAGDSPFSISGLPILLNEFRAEVLADFVDRCAIALSGCCPECDAATAIVRGRVQPTLDGAPVPERAEPLIVRRFDTSIEPDRACGETEMVVCAVAEDGRPVALLLDDETRDKLAGLLGLGPRAGTAGGAR